ncbi:MAG: hypothetical protein K0S53_1480 [Bacteroidetes bacterium]|jgi:hypothetical protein|nr:hypothetical protein [Bacteroidota bacterium]MDF2451748.1 hypothetical protein [Bacteroidota bacterium]
MDKNDLSVIFGKTAIWDFYMNNEHVESLRYDAQNNFITNNGSAYSISKIDICVESGVLSFEKKAPGSKAVKASLVFIKDKSMLVGFEGSKQVKYVKTGKKSFSCS